MARFSEGLMSSILKQADPEIQLERDVVLKHVDTQNKLAYVGLSKAVREIAQDISALRSEDESGNRVAISALEKMMHDMAS